VDDDAHTRLLLIEQLSQAGHDVRAYENGVQAIEAIRQMGSCLVVADWQMPELDGLALCKLVHELSRQAAIGTVYFILLTAHNEKEMIVRGLDAGANDYLVKPYHVDELLARIRAGQRICELQDDNWRRRFDLERMNAELDLLTRKLERQANVDALTGLFNRRCALERLSEAWTLVERNEQPLSCIVLDLDGFKHVNDTHGHAGGDAVLRRLATVTRGCVRACDVVGRIGGEEFICICPSTDVTGAAVLAERLRKAIQSTVVAVDGLTIPITISAGVAERTASHKRWDDLLAAADALLYQAKRNGRNQVWVPGRDGPQRYVAPLDPVSPQPAWR
jgi:two-component system cell cycle response regulator